MSSIRKTKKTIKKTINKNSGFFSIIIDNNMIFCVSEWHSLKYHKKGISINNEDYLPYKTIHKIIIEKDNIMVDAFEEDLLLMQDLGECPDGDIL